MVCRPGYGLALMLLMNGPELAGYSSIGLVFNCAPNRALIASESSEIFAQIEVWLIIHQSGSAKLCVGN